MNAAVVAASVIAQSERSLPRARAEQSVAVVAILHPGSTMSTRPICWIGWRMRSWGKWVASRNLDTQLTRPLLEA